MAMRGVKDSIVCKAVALACLVAAPAHAGAPGTLASTGSVAVSHALIIGTLSGDPKGAYARNMRDWMSRFAVVLTNTCGLSAADIRILGETPDPSTVPPVQESTLQNVRDAFDQLRKQVRPDDPFILFIVGHGTVTEPVGKLCLPGPDLTATELARLLDGLAAKRMIVIDCASGGADFMRRIAKRDRVTIAAAVLTGQGVQTCFAEFFLLGYETGKADKNGDKIITLSEAFNWAAADCVNWYHRQYHDVRDTERKTIRVQGRETARIFAKLYRGSDTVMTPDSDMNGEDAEPDFSRVDGQYGDVWNGRRETTEQAAYDDLGDEKGFLHWAANEHHWLSGKPGSEGAFGARVVPGRPVLLPEAK